MIHVGCISVGFLLRKHEYVWAGINDLAKVRSQLFPSAFIKRLVEVYNC